MNRKLAVDILDKEGSVILTCNGHSMKPLFSPGDALYIKKVNHSKLRIGDAVFCKIGRNLQVHKITAILAPTYAVHNGRWEISNNHGHLNGWIDESGIYGLCMKAKDRVLVSEEELEKR
jgi:signal peptidase I